MRSTISLASELISTIFTQTNQYRVILEAEPDLQSTLASLNTIYLPTSSAATGQVPLSAIAKVSIESPPLQINHLGQFPANTVSFNLAPSVSLGEAVAAVQQTEGQIGVPRGLITAYEGTALAFQSALKNELYLILAAIVTVYIVLGVLYESFVHPITILSTLPSAGIGALWD